MGTPVEWDDGVMATAIQAADVRCGDQLEVHFRRPGDLTACMEWVEVTEVGAHLIHVDTWPVERGTDPKAAAIALAEAYAEHSGVAVLVTGATWVRP